MSGYDEIRCEMPMPASELGPDTVFHTRAFIAVFGESYTITSDGRLVRHPWPSLSVSPVEDGQEESLVETGVRDPADQARKDKGEAFNGDVEFWTTEPIRRTFFVGLWLVRGGEVTRRPRSTPKAVAAGFTSGVTTMVAHSGGPPLAMYLLPLGLGKDIYAGTTSLFFTVGNVIKAVPWLLLVQPTGQVWMLMAVCLLAIPAGVWLGWRLHGALDQRQIYRACYGLLVVTALKLLWDGVSGFLA